MMVGILIKLISGHTFLHREGTSNQTGAKRKVKLNTPRFFICPVPQAVENSQTILMSITCTGQFLKDFRMICKPPGECPVPEFPCLKCLAAPGMAEKLPDVAQLFQLRLVDKLLYFLRRKSSGIKPVPDLIPHFIHDDGRIISL